MKLLTYQSLLILTSAMPMVMTASLLLPFSRSSVDDALSDHGLRIAALESSVSQILVQLNGEGKRPSLQRRPEIRRSSRSDTSVPSIKRVPSDTDSKSSRLHEGYLSPPDA